MLREEALMVAMVGPVEACMSDVIGTYPPSASLSTIGASWEWMGDMVREDSSMARRVVTRSLWYL